MMKNKLLIIAFLMISFISCKKDDSLEANIIGKWELDSSIDGWSPKKTYQAGNGTTVSFTSSTFEFYSEGKLTNSGNYRIVKEKSILSQEIGDRLILNESNDIRLFISVENGMLAISIDAYDAGGSAYRKIK